MNYYDFDGQPINQQTWGDLFHGDDRVFGRDHINEHLISTVWLGIDHGFGYSHKPLIFESMVFCEHKPECDWCYVERRYSTKEDALLGHATLCNNLTGEKHDEQEGL